MKRLLPILLTAMLLLTGCSSWLDGNYHNVIHHEDDSGQTSDLNITAADYDSLYSALVSLVENGTESGIIYVPEYDQDAVEKDMNEAAKRIMEENPIAAYAAEEIKCDFGTNSGQRAVSVKIAYVYDQKDILKIRRVESMGESKTVITEQLDDCSDGVVLYIHNYEPTDFVQLVEDYANEYPQMVMETPQVRVNIYPEAGTSRVVELKFTYQTSRETLRAYQGIVGRRFESAMLYVSSDAAETEKFTQLYSYLTQLNDYEVKTSITPAYSLLRHGEGDSKAFATVYAAMCREAGLECQVITGTRWGEAWCWSLICDDGVWYHVDLLRCSADGAFTERTDADMDGYAWDYAAYPVSDGMKTDPTEETEAVT